MELLKGLSEEHPVQLTNEPQIHNQAHRPSQKPPPYKSTTASPPYSAAEAPAQSEKPYLDKASTPSAYPPRPTHPQAPAAVSAYPPQPFHAQAPSRTLHLRYDNLMCSRVKILDADEKTRLYTAHLRSAKRPHIVLEAAAGSSSNTNTNPIGTAVFHLTTSRIDATVRGQPIALISQSMWKSSHLYSSPARHGATMRWKGSGIMDLSCTDEQGVQIARFTGSNWSMTKWGKMEMMAGVEGALLEEVLVTGVTLVQYNLTVASAATA